MSENVLSEKEKLLRIVKRVSSKRKVGKVKKPVLRISDEKEPQGIASDAVELLVLTSAREKVDLSNISL